MKISNLKYSKKGDRVHIYVDGTYTCTVQQHLVIDLDIYNEKTVTEEEIKNIVRQDQIFLIYSRAVQLVIRRPRSTLELRQYIKKKLDKDIREQDEIIEKIIARLKKDQLVDDQKFAEWWVRNRTEFKPRGKYLLRAELKQKGIAQEIVTSVLSALSSEEEMSAAKKLGEKKKRLLGDVESEKNKKKFLEYLVRKGYSYQIAKQVLQALT